ncbi:hypothetical protein [Chamaesiphon sp.]|uniref:DUF7219 family protein n=1 Tax=Chamaesiphon sp. TaxID=2814140 RepID=UPI003593D945
MDVNRNIDSFLYPINRYYGDVKPENLAFNHNLQEFTQRTSLICALETGGKLSPEEAYQQIKLLWQELKASKKSLRVNEN